MSLNLSIIVNYLNNRPCAIEKRTNYSNNHEQYKQIARLHRLYHLELPKPLFEGEAKCKAVDKRMIFILNIQIKLSLVLKVRVICVYGLLQLTFASIVKNFDG